MALYATVVADSSVFLDKNMCGIAGIYTKNSNGCGMSGVVTKMIQLQLHRGPDGVDYYSDEDVSLGHCRLAIIDLAETAKQPMSNENGTLWIAHNGEIYNYRELKSILLDKGHIFKSNSDTEVIIHSYEEWGEQCLQKLRGMFAFAVWNKKNKTLFMARDRLGIKPFYYYENGNNFVFASELKAIITSDLVNKEIDFESVGLFLSYGSIPAPKTIYKNIKSLLPGHYLTVKSGKSTIHRYYDLKDAYLDSSLQNISENDAINRVSTTLKETIKAYLVSDVPVGCFLSGGIDSSSIVALMNEFETNIRTVSVIFPGTSYDESKYARTVAKKFGTGHIEIEVTANSLIEHLDKIFATMDQPTIDGVNTYFVSWAAKKAGLKVAMSGVGGDEIFWGYPSIKNIPKLYKLLSILSSMPFGRRMANFFLKNSNNSQKAKLYSMISNDLSIRQIYLNYRGLFNIEQIKNLLSPDFAEEVIKEFKPVSYLQDCLKINNESNQVSFLEANSYMANQLLRDTDVFSMTHSLEIRVPFVDHILVELLARIPPKYKIGKDMPKRLLVRALNSKLPYETVRRPKMGFTFPLDLWLKGEIKQEIESELRESKVFNQEYINQLLHLFSNNKIHWSKIWGLFVLNKFLNENFN